MTPSKPVWLITGATSAISDAFAKHVSALGHDVILVGRNDVELKRQCQDLHLRFKNHCQMLVQDFSKPLTPLKNLLRDSTQELALFIGHSAIVDNDALDEAAMTNLLQTNITSTCTLIHLFMHKPQPSHALIFLSSVAAARGRAKNSLYGASKAAIEVYLQGLQQHTKAHRLITIIRLGYIDTPQTYGMLKVFYAASPERAAHHCLSAHQRQKSFSYYPFFWRGLVAVLKGIPVWVYKHFTL